MAHSLKTPDVSAELRAQQDADWAALNASVLDCPDGTLKTLAMLFLYDYQEPFRRAAAARSYHHARRGGLVEHVSKMAQSAVALCAVYPELRRDLLIAGVIFHDAGKMLENQFEPEGFEMPFNFRAECYGHILLGVQLAHKTWATLDPETQARDINLLDALCHLTASHHGTLEWGSPVEPKLPEAVALHFIDNLDAKLEMMRATYITPKPLAPGVIEGARPLSRTILVLS